MSTPCAGDGPEQDQDEEGVLLCDGLEHAFVGLMQRFGQPSIACYDRDRVLEGYVADGMTYEEAVEFFEFNVIGAWAGPTTPCFLSPMTLEELRDQLDV